MPTNRLAKRWIDTLKPGRKTCDFHDSEMKAPDVRIPPPGRKRYARTGDRGTEATAERIGGVISGMLEVNGSLG